MPDPSDQAGLLCVADTFCGYKQNPCPGDQDCHKVNGANECLPKRRGRNEDEKEVAETSDHNDPHNVEQLFDKEENEVESWRNGGFDNEASSSEDVDKSCPYGMEYSEKEERCVDEDECLNGKALCFDEELCVNTNGSYTCDKVNCDDGSKLNSAGVCEKIKCDIGKEYDLLWEECRDIDECATNPCKDDEICRNTPGSFNCNKSDCTKGYRPSQFFGCVDIDECEAQTHNCSANETCVNKDGGFFCDCARGFTKTDESDACVDIDECKRPFICSGMGTKCVNTHGSYRCDCEEGYESDKGAIRKVCMDIDECKQSDACPEGQLCANKIGGHDCNCPFGMSNENGTCIGSEDDEAHHCIIGINASSGQKECKCPDGFVLNKSNPQGQVCEDINECEYGNLCKDKGNVCVNSYGSHECLDVTCPEKYEAIKDNK